MVDVSAVEALDHKLAREPEVFAHLKCLLVNVLTREVLGNAAVVCVAKLDFVVLVVKQVVNVHVVHVTLDVLQINVVSLVSGIILLACNPLWFVFFMVFFRGAFSIVCFLEPGVDEDLRNRKSGLRLEAN